MSYCTGRMSNPSCICCYAPMHPLLHLLCVHHCTHHCTHHMSTVVPTTCPPLYPLHIHRCTHCASTIVPTHCASIIAPAMHPLLRLLHIHHCTCHVSVVVLLCLSCARLVPIIHALLSLSCVCCCAHYTCIVVPIVCALLCPSCVCASLRPSSHLLLYSLSATYEWVPGHTLHTHWESDLPLLLACISQMMINEEVRGIPYLHDDEHVLSSQRIGRRGALSQHGITCAHAGSNSDICLPDSFHEGEEGDIRISNKKGTEGTHPLEATEGWTSQKMERMSPSEGHELGKDK